MNTSIQTPMSRFVAKLESMGKKTIEKRSGAYYYFSAQCPAHDDKNPSLSVGMDSQGLLMLKCFAGCSTDAILESVSFAKADMVPDHLKKEWVDAQKKNKIDSICTVENFAARKKLPLEFLQQRGLINRENSFKITYYDIQGVALKRYRIRTKLSGKKHTIWDSEFKGEPISIYGLQFLPWTHADFDYIILTEGESDALTLWFNQFPALGVPGASSVQTLEDGVLNGIDKVYVVSEPDDAGQAFPENIKARLQTQGYPGKVFRIDFDKIKHGDDPSDVWVNLNADKDAFRAAMITALMNAVEVSTTKGARPPKDPARALEGTGVKTYPSKKAHNEAVAKEDAKFKKNAKPDYEYDAKRLPSTNSEDVLNHYLRTEWIKEDKVFIKQYLGNFYEFKKNVWRLLEMPVLQAKIMDYLKDMLAPEFNKTQKMWEYVPINFRFSFIKELINMLSCPSVVIETETETPFWMVKPKGWTPYKHYLPMNNGIFDTDEMVLLPCNGDFFNLSVVENDYDPDATWPDELKKWTCEMWPKDAGQIKAFQQIGGYLISGRTDLQKMFMILGRMRSGKGTIIKLFTALLGNNNVTFPTLNEFCEHKGLEPIIGKSLIVFSDIRIDHKSNTTVAVERLLSISGEDMINVGRLFRVAIELNSKARVLWISNQMPELKDPSAALASRFIILKISESFLGKEDTALFRKLKACMPGNFNWFLQGLKDLRQSGRIFEPECSKIECEKMAGIQSPVSIFCNEMLEFNNNFRVTKDEVFKTWRDWNEAQGSKGKGKIMFFRDLDALYSGLKFVRERWGNERKMTIEGVRVRQYEKMESEMWPERE